MTPPPPPETHRGSPPARRDKQGVGSGEVDKARASIHFAFVVGAPAFSGG